MLEKDIERKVTEWCKKNDIFQSKIMNMPGFPDRIFWVRGGKPVLLEFKKPETGRVSPLQAHIMNTLRERGYDVHVVDNFDDAKRILCNGNPISTR